MKNEVDDALSSVRQLQDLLLQKSIFQGYSGVARMISGTLALAAGVALSSRWAPADPLAHVAGWGIVVAVSLAVNYASLLYWFAFLPEIRRNPRVLKPALDAVPALVVGAVFSAALVLRADYDYLFGAWLSLYGLAQVAYRQSLPPGIYRVGLGYIACGAWYLLYPEGSFLRPWPVGVIFFAGEWIGGVVLCRCRKPAGEEGGRP